MTGRASSGATSRPGASRSRRSTSRAATGAAWDDALLARALHAVQSELEPPGIAARDVRESLLLQVDAALDGRDGAVRAAPQALEDARTSLADHWTDFLENRLPRIEQRAHLPMARISAARDVLRRLRLAPRRS
ncbi:MAG: hypothetical protein ACKOHI_11020, partial [Phycisphaerales bacterium]